MATEDFSPLAVSDASEEQALTRQRTKTSVFHCCQDSHLSTKPTYTCTSVLGGSTVQTRVNKCQVKVGLTIIYL